MATGSKKPAARRRRPAVSGSVTEKLRIDFVIISDSAQEVGGKLYMMGGGWDIYRAKSYPAAVQFGLGIGILVPWNATNERHTLTFIIRSADGQPVLGSGKGQFEVGRSPGTRPGMTQRVVVGFSGQIEIPSPGIFEIEVEVPGDKRRVTFDAVEV
jgi:hypothetical protein